MTVQAPQNRQHALISDFVELANMSIQEEATSATNWIDDRPEGLTLQNLALANPSRESIGNCKGLFSVYGSPSTSFFTEHAFQVLHVTSRHRRWRFGHICSQR